MLGERNCWAKVWMGWYEETSHTPLFIWDPRSGKRGERRRALVQPALDLGPTLLEFFSMEKCPDMLGLPLRESIESDTPIRAAALFGHFGGDINITAGRFVYLRNAVYQTIHTFHYPLLPTVMPDSILHHTLTTCSMA